MPGSQSGSQAGRAALDRRVAGGGRDRGRWYTVETLPPGQREAVQLLYLDGLNEGEVATDSASLALL